MLSLQIHLQPEGTNPLDLAWDLNREFGFEMLVWANNSWHLCELVTDDCWSYESYLSKTLWPDGVGSEFPKHWRFAVLDPLKW